MDSRGGDGTTGGRVCDAVHNPAGDYSGFPVKARAESSHRLAHFPQDFGWRAAINPGGDVLVGADVSCG